MLLSGAPVFQCQLVNKLSNSWITRDVCSEFLSVPLSVLTALVLFGFVILCLLWRCFRLMLASCSWVLKPDFVYLLHLGNHPFRLHIIYPHLHLRFPTCLVPKSRCLRATLDSVILHVSSCCHHSMWYFWVSSFMENTNSSVVISSSRKRSPLVHLFCSQWTYLWTLSLVYNVLCRRTRCTPI